MNRRLRGLLAGVLILSGGCTDFLDVNTNPNGPQSVTANLYLPPMLHWLVTSPQFDGRFVGHYTQEWISTSTAFDPAQSWGRMGFQPGSDNGAQQWRDVYWSLGQNLIDMNTKAQAEQRWDLLGVGMILKAWGWQVLTDLHGEIIIKEAFDATRTSFDYDTQDYAYQEVKRLLDSAVVLLGHSDGAVDQAYLAVGDHIYGGDRTKWLKFAHGMLARYYHHFANKKATYDPAQVIAQVDQSLTSEADDALLTYPATSTDFADYNFWGRTRNNATLYRQTQFVLNLMNGTQFGGVVDPRLTRMLSPSPNGQYRGLDPNILGFGALPDSQKPNNFFGYPGTGGLGLPGRYLFADRAKIPAMTYAELQFIKAEAALKMGDRATALAALCPQQGQGGTADQAEIQLGVRLEPGRAEGHRGGCYGLPHHAAMDHSTVTRIMNRYGSLAALLCSGLLSACEKNTVQVLPTAPLAGAQIKFFNFGVNAPGVNFYADATKMTAIQSGTGVESTNGVTYGGAGAGGVYTTIAPGQHIFTGRIAATVDKDLPIASVTTTIADGKSYSFYLSGFYNTTAKTVDGFVVEDPFTVPTDYTVANVRFVHAMGNAN